VRRGYRVKISEGVGRLSSEAGGHDALPLREPDGIGPRYVVGHCAYCDPLRLRPDRVPFPDRKAALAPYRAMVGRGIRPNEHAAEDGPTISARACRLGTEEH
jgi:hypothetical protein